ncbi:hypothetical protein TNCT_674871 [Trichonephila clavata]|uniref:Uncharacterized protein n=1 Tax=Trichonephila clavata TaxID=2740835 RepID=A0A8X6KZK7_TRICU|nr:hypothetical protein TNCT_674871 [Trichonephila clavata]
MKNKKKSSPRQPSPQEMRSKSPVSDCESMDTQAEQKTSLTPAPLPPPLSELEEDLQSLAHSMECCNFCEHLDKILLSIDDFHFNLEADRIHYADKLSKLLFAAIAQRKELRASENSYIASVDERYNRDLGISVVKEAPFIPVKGKKTNARIATALLHLLPRPPRSRGQKKRPSPTHLAYSNWINKLSPKKS